MHIPLELWVLSLIVIGCVGFFIGAWVCQGAERERMSGIEDQIALWKAKYQGLAGQPRKDLVKAFDIVKAELDRHQIVGDEGLEKLNWKDGYRAGLKSILVQLMGLL